MLHLVRVNVVVYTASHKAVNYFCATLTELNLESVVASRFQIFVYHWFAMSCLLLLDQV